MPETVMTDRAATALSVACIIHCLALPIIASVLPFIAALAEAEWVHWLFAGTAILASARVLLHVKAARTPAFIVPAAFGIMLLIAGLTADLLGIDETLATVIGGLFLAGAHGRRLWAHGAHGANGAHR